MLLWWSVVRACCVLLLDKILVCFFLLLISPLAACVCVLANSHLGFICVPQNWLRRLSWEALKGECNNEAGVGIVSNICTFREIWPKQMNHREPNVTCFDSFRNYLENSGCTLVRRCFFLFQAAGSDIPISRSVPRWLSVGLRTFII